MEKIKTGAHRAHCFYVKHKKHIWSSSGVLVIFTHYYVPVYEVHTTVLLGFLCMELV